MLWRIRNMSVINDLQKKILDEFEQKITYHFAEPGLLKQALTHSSYSNEMKINKSEDNERLEFLGDAVLELITSEFLYFLDDTMKEGDLSKLRASLVCEQTLSMCARDIDLGTFIFLGKGEDVTGGRERSSILSDAMEAIIGAIYLDGGQEKAKDFIMTFILHDIDHMKLFNDSKTKLQEFVQSEYKKQLTYCLVSEEGPDHDKRFSIQVKMDDTPLSTGVGRTKKAAAQDAAFRSLMKLKATTNNR